MKFDKSVSLFLGAGASRAFGFPTTVEFMDDVKEKVPHQDFFDAVVNSINNSVDKQQSLDIETVLSEIEDFEEHAKDLFDNKRFKRTYLLESGQIYREDRDGRRTPLLKFYQDHINIVKTLRDEIYKRVYHTYWEEPQEQEESFRDTYLNLFNQFNNNIFDIFTTNYHLCIEYTFWGKDDLRQQFTDGFMYDGKDVTFRNNFFENQKYRYRLFKLHGSVNWKRNPNDPNKITRFNQPDFTNLDHHPILFPGSKYTGIPPFNTLYQNFRQQLSKIPYCIIIGFSFRDEEINKIFKQALEGNKRLKYVIWNKNKTKHPFEQFPKGRIIEYIKPFSQQNIAEFTEELNRQENQLGFKN